MRIPDPIELMEDRIDAQTGLVDADGTYPCVECGERKPLETTDWVCMSPMGDGPLMCPGCFDREPHDPHIKQQEG